MITFRVDLTIGKKFLVNGFPNSTLNTVLNNFIANQCPMISKINAAICNANTLDMNKTLLENNISHGSVVLLITEINNIKPQTILKNSNNKNISKKISIAPLNNIQSNQNLFNPNHNLSHSLTMANMKIPKIIPNLIQHPKISKKSILSKSPQKLINQKFEPDEEKCINFLLKKCNLPLKIFDFNFNCINNWNKGLKYGPKGYEKKYDAPEGWIGIGLKVKDLYDNGDNTWLGTGNKKGEWYAAYHPIKTLNSISGILNNGFRRGPYQDCKDDININPLTKKKMPKCGEGVYFIPEIKETKKYTKIFEFSGDKFSVAFMCRINPYKVRIADIGLNEESWIINGDKLEDSNGRKRDDEVRPYKIIFFIEK